MSAQFRDRTRRGGPLEPGQHLRAELKRLGLNQIAVSRAAGVSRQTVNNIVNGRHPISRAMAAKLAGLTGRSADYWLQSSFPQARDGRAAHRGILADHEIVRAVRDGVIGVAGFDETHVRGATLNLTLGAVTAPRGADSARGVRVARGRSVRVVTGEHITLPDDHLARVGATPHLARLGAIAAHALHVDPGFAGRLEVCIFNAGEHDFVLRTGDPVLSLEIVPLAPAPGRAAAAKRRRPGRR